MLIRNKVLIASSFSMAAVILVVLFYVLGVTEQARENGPTKLVIDHDGGADDAMAIFMALLYEKYYYGPEVVTLTTTYGNVGEDQVFNNTQRILDVADRRNVPIYRGSSKALVQGFQSDYYFGSDGLGDNMTVTYKPIRARKGHAALQLIKLSKSHKGELAVVALGSLTNIALAIRLDPEFISRLSQLYVAAGHIYGEDYEKPEFNAAMDVEAYHIVAESGAAEKLTIIPFSQVLMSQNITKEWRVDVLGSIQSKIMQAQNVFEQKSFKSSSYWSLLDPSAMAVVLAEKTVVEETRYSNNSITLCGDMRGINTNDFTTKEEANARIVYELKVDPYKQFLYDLFSKDVKTKRT